MTEHETLNLDKGLHSRFFFSTFLISNENIFYVPILKFKIRISLNTLCLKNIFSFLFLNKIYLN